MRLFLDTNVLIDYLIEERPCHRLVADFIATAREGGEQFVFATSQATDVYYILMRTDTNSAVRRGLRVLYQICDLYPTSPTACVAALDSPMPDYEDAVQAEVAREARCDYIITRDYTDYAVSPVPYIDPAGFLALYSSRDTQEAEN